MQKQHKKLKKLSDRISNIESKLSFWKSLAIALIGFFGTALAIYIDKIKYGTFNLPTEWGFLQIMGLVIFFSIFCGGVVLLSKKK